MIQGLLYGSSTRKLPHRGTSEAIGSHNPQSPSQRTLAAVGVAAGFGVSGFKFRLWVQYLGLWARIATGFSGFKNGLTGFFREFWDFASQGLLRGFRVLKTLDLGGGRCVGHELRWLANIRFSHDLRDHSIMGPKTLLYLLSKVPILCLQFLVPSASIDS